jgi:cation diffusion facilitator family transporter
MHTTDVSRWKHDHDFAVDTSSAESRMRKVIALAVLMMVTEIAAGTILHSMALLADGWHMGTHVMAFVITALAYYYGRKHAGNARFTFGTGKVSVLGGYTSAVILSMVAVFMVWEAVHRLFVPVTVHYREAIFIACAGLAVNVICALLLKDDHHHHHHGHGHDHGHHHDHGGHSHHSDMNLRSAYVHVIADAFTSLTAIAALAGGRYFGWVILDPLMGLFGAAVIGSWAFTLLRDSSTILLDQTPSNTDLPDVIRTSVESDGDSLVSDLHVWQVGANKYAAIVGIVAHEPKSAAEYREALREHEELVHVTIETHVCHGEEARAH